MIVETEGNRSKLPDDGIYLDFTPAAAPLRSQAILA